MRHAYVMESQAAERYAECADVLEAHNNRETASLFRTLARIEKIHSEQVLSSMGWDKAPLPTTLAAEAFDDDIEGVDPTELHYRMHAYHALSLALRGTTSAEQVSTSRINTSDLTNSEPVTPQAPANIGPTVRIHYGSGNTVEKTVPQ